MEDLINNNDLSSLIKNLNSTSNLPKNGLRRNSSYYPLLTYINHSIAMYISGSYDEVALFINRADKEFEASQLDDEKYVRLCRDYLKVITEELLQNNLISDLGKALLIKKNETE